MKKVLIITYSWPPMGGGGVVRWLKTSKYLRDLSWDPIIFTPQNPELSILDKSLEEDFVDNLETIRNPIWEPFNLYRFFRVKSSEKKVYPGFLNRSEHKSFFESFFIWIRGNIFIPDAKIFWYWSSVKRLSHYLQRNNINVIVSTGPPHTNHLIAMKVSKRFGIPWVADFRDPWTNIDFYNKLQLTYFADRIHKKLELKVLKSAHAVTTVSESWSDDFYKISARKPIVINNGYDSSDFANRSSIRLDSSFSITHAGSMNADRNPNIFWEALSLLLKSDLRLKNDLEIKLIGPIDITIIKSIKEHKLNDYVTCIDYLDHASVIDHLIASQLLLLPLNNTPNVRGIIPGKTYEYIAARRPILCVGDVKGDTARILLETKAGTVVGFDDNKLMNEEVLRCYNLFKNNDLTVDSVNYNKYSRKVLAGKFAKVFDSLYKT